jgi:hypothetical protein
MNRSAAGAITLNVTEPNQGHLPLRQADAVRADLYAICDELDFIKVQIARLPKRKELARTALLAALDGAALAVAGVASGTVPPHETAGGAYFPTVAASG